MAAHAPTPESLSWTHKVLRADPFRLFFPLGALAGVVGVGEWLFWTVGRPVDMIGFLHTTLQSQGFLALFVFGFLLTALPRFSGAGYAEPWETLAALAGALTFLGGSLARSWTLAQAGFLFMQGSVWVFALRRLVRSTKAIPPSFPLLGLGMLHAFAGSLILAFTQMGQVNFDLFLVGRQMVQLGFLLCMVLGVTGKLAPFLMGYAGDPREEQAPPGFPPLKLAAPHVLTGLLIFAGFFTEPHWPRASALARAFLATAHLLTYARIGRLPAKRTAVILFFWLSCWLTPLGLWAAALWPAYRVAALHVTFVGGFSLMIFSFGLLVTFSHTGRAALLNGPLRPLKAAGFLTLGAAALRASADLFPAHIKALLHNAAGLWVLAALVWLGYALWARVPSRGTRVEMC